MDKCNKCGAEFVRLWFPADFKIPLDYKGFQCGYCQDGFVFVSDPGGIRGDWTWKQLQAPYYRDSGGWF